MLDARRRDWVPSMPTTEPPNALETPGPRTLTNNWLTSSLQQTKVNTVMCLQFLIAVLLRNKVFRDVTLCHCVSGSWYFEGSWCLNLQNQGDFLDCLTLEDGTNILKNTGNHSSNITVLGPRKRFLLKTSLLIHSFYQSNCAPQIDKYCQFELRSSIQTNLEDSCNNTTALRAMGFSLEAFSQPEAV